jgi:hypothetical protein
MKTHDADILIHPTDWDGYLRYATHPRGEDWRPPFLSVPIAKMEKAADGLTPHRLGLFLLYVCAYARAPLIDPEAGPRSPRAFHEDSASMYRRLGQKVTSLDREAWIKAGLAWTSTVDGRSINGRSTARTRVGLGLDSDSDSDWDSGRAGLGEESYGPTFAHLNGDDRGAGGDGRCPASPTL